MKKKIYRSLLGMLLFWGFHCVGTIFQEMLLFFWTIAFIIFSYKLAERALSEKEN